MLDSQIFKNRVWSYIRKAKRFTSTDVARATGYPYPKVSNYLRALEKADVVSETNGRSHNAPRALILVKDTGIYPPSLDSKGNPKPLCYRQKCWSAMRVLKSFTSQDLSLTTGVAVDTLSQYLTALEKAGYLFRNQKKRGFGGHSTYVFPRRSDTGPLAPLLSSRGVVTDLNLVYQEALGGKGK